MSGYAVLMEGGGGSYSAYVPDLPGCVAAGGSIDEVERLIREAVPAHLASLRDHGEPVPPASTAAVAIIDVG